MAKNVRHGSLVVNFISSGGQQNDVAYSVYDRDTNETHRVSAYPDGTVRGVGRDATENERAAILAFQAAEDAEYQQWRMRNENLFA